MSGSYRHRIRVRYAETDAQQVAHHGAYVAWLEEARIEALRSIGHSYRDLEQGGVLMPVVALQLRYRAAARFDDQVDLVTTVTAEGRFQLVFASRLHCAERLLAEAEVTVACVDASGRLCRVPAEIAAQLTGG